MKLLPFCLKFYSDWFELSSVHFRKSQENTFCFLKFTLSEKNLHLHHFLWPTIFCEIIRIFQKKTSASHHTPAIVQGLQTLLQCLDTTASLMLSLNCNIGKTLAISIPQLVLKLPLISCKVNAWFAHANESSLDIAIL